MNNFKHIYKSLASVAAMVSLVSMTACDDEPDKYEVAGGTPTIKYIRTTLPAQADSLIDQAYMENTIAIVGNNLRSVYEMYFNDKKAVLNTSYMTDHTILVDVPKEIPEKVSNKIFMVTKDHDTLSYDFKVLVPQPLVNSMSCEFARPGDLVTIYGDYLIDDENVPLKITMAGNVPVTDIKSITKTAVSFVLPADAPEGYINVSSIYGTGRSKFQYHDTRNILFDWDGSHGGLATAHGWRDGSKVIVAADENSIDGAYIRFASELSGEIGGTWAEDACSFNYWPEPGSSEFGELSARPAFAKMIEEYGIEGLQMKFEVNVPASNPWQSCALQMIFSSNATVTYATASNAYFSTPIPRGLWIPWRTTGSYDTNGEWTTVSINLSDFNKNNDGTASSRTISAEDLTGLTFFVWHGGLAGKDCNPVIMIDNIRVVPIEKN